MYQRRQCQCNKYGSKKCDFCRNRLFQNNSGKLGALLSAIKKETLDRPIRPTLENDEEVKYKQYNYNGSYHKGLQHNLTDGRLVSTADYRTMVDGIVKVDQKLLLSVPLATGSTIKLANPLASSCTVLIGAEQSVLRLTPPPSLSSSSGAAEMVELYSEAIARDVPFINYGTDPIIQSLLGPDRLNNISVVSYLRYSPLYPLNCNAAINNSKVFTPQNIFRSPIHGSLKIYVNVCIRIRLQYFYEAFIALR